MVVGEPGIGKTRIVQELETYARMRGGEVLWGRAHAATGAPSYWPWVQVIRSHVAAAGSDELRSQLGTAAPEVARIVPEVRGAYRRWVHAIRSYLAASGPEELRSQLAAGASEVARIVPEVRERFPDLPEPEPVRDSESAEFRLFDAITTLLKNASAETPLVVVLDDLHWMERPALLLLEHLSREIGSARLLVVGTYGDVESGRQGPLAEALAELSRGGGLQTVDLRGLSEQDVAGYIREAAGVEPSSQLVNAVYRETAGNPFFVSEVVLLMAQDGTLESGEVSVPPGVRAAVGRRLSALSEGCNELLTVAAVVGREFTDELLVMLSDADDAGVLGLEEEALAAHVIEESDAAGQYRFSHALVEETLLGELSTTRRVRLHGRIAEALEELPGQRAAEHAAALAWHFAESATLSRGHAERAARYSRIAAEQAEAQFAWEQAVRHYERCLALVGESDDGLGEEEAELLIALAGCQRNAAGAAATSRSLIRAIDLYRRRRDGRGMARTVLELDVQGAAGASDQSLSELAEEALAVLGRSDSQLEAGLLALRARDHFDETAERFAERAAQLAREHGYADVEAQLLDRAAHRPDALMRFDEARSGARAAHGAFDRLRNYERAAHHLRDIAASLLLEGRLDDAEAAAEEDIVYAREHQARREEQQGLALLASVALVRCDFGRVDALHDEAPGASYLRDSLWASRVEAGGDVRRALALAPRPDHPAGVDAAGMAAVHGARARILLGAKNTEAARRELETWAIALAASPFVDGWRPWAYAEVDECLPALGDERAVRAAYDELASWGSIRLLVWGARGLDRIRGGLALRLDLADAAEQHFHAGLSWAERERCPVEQGRCLQGLAEVAMRRRERGEAIRELERAAELFERHGAGLYLERARTRQRELGGR